MKSKLFLVILLLLLIPSSNVYAYTDCTETGGGGSWFVCEDWDVGTPPNVNWPCSEYACDPDPANTCCHTWHGWTMTDTSITDDDSAILITSPKHSGTRSLRQVSQYVAEQRYATDMYIDLGGARNAVYIRFYVYFTDLTQLSISHFLFMDTAHANVALDLRTCSDSTYAHCPENWMTFAAHSYSDEYEYYGCTWPNCFNLYDHLNEWILVEWLVDPLNDRTSIWINGTQYVNNFSMDFIGSTVSTAIISGWRSAGTVNDWTFYLDDFVVSPTYIGPRGCSVDGDCDDSNVCTTDTCPAGECVFTNNTDACDDGLYCTTGEACSGGVCTGGSARNCADADACTTDSCNEATDACDHTGSCSALIPEPKGVYLLGGLGTTTTIGNLVDSWISGYAGRVSWTTLDTGTVQDDHAVYVWTYIDAVVNGAETYGKPFTLCVHTIVPPPWIVAHAGETYTPRISGDEYTTPVPWDSTSLGYQEAFALELANHVTGAYGALKDNPLFMGIRTSLIGLKGLDEDEGDEMTALGTYNRADFWVGVKRSMHAWADAFPTKAIYVEMAPFSDATESPQLDDWLIDQYTAEFDGSPYQQIGVFMESQKGYTPAPTGGAGVNLLHAISHGSYVLFQACGSWLNRSPCGANWPADDYWPENGFNLGYGAYGCTYYEYYNSDLTNAPWQTMLQQWHDFFAGAGAISRPGPASLSAGTSGSTSMQ